MAEQGKAPDPVVTAGNLVAAVRDLIPEVRRLGKSQRRSWKFIAFDIVLTLALSVVSFIAVHASNSAQQANSAQLALCRAGNTARAQQVDLWMYLISLSTPPPTAQGKAVIGKFEHHLEVVFAPRNCSELGR